MNIDCCKSYVGKQIIGLLPNEEECLYYLVINGQDVGATDWTGWLIDGVSVYTSGYYFYTNTFGNQSLIVSYIGTQPSEVVLDNGLGNLYPYTVEKVTNYGGSCEKVCYQAMFDNGYLLTSIDFFNLFGATPLSTGLDIDDENAIETYINNLLGTTSADVSSIWNGSKYVITINNAYNLGGLTFDDGLGNITPFNVLPCEITPPEPVPQDLLTLYPGATAAYSVRKLSSSYSGAALRVRRSSDNTEQDIGFDSNGDLDTTALIAFVGGFANGFVTKWYDQGGSGRDFLQSTANEQPRIVSSGTIDNANSIPSLFFGTANVKYMEVALANESAFDFTNTYSIYMAAKPANQAGSQVIFGKGQSLFAADGYYIDVGASNSYLLINNNTSSPTNQAILNNTSINLGCYGYNLSSGNGKSSFNGTIINNSTGLISAKLSNKLPTIGIYSIFSSTTDFDGWFSELIVYPTDQSANRVGIETNITTYYSI